MTLIHYLKIKTIKNFIKKRLMFLRASKYLSPISNKQRDELEALHNKYSDKRCFIIGNGPSLNKCDLSLLDKEFTFGVNSIFYKTQEMGFKPTFYVVEDEHVLNDNLDKINAFECRYKFFPSFYRNKVSKKNSLFLPLDIGFYREEHDSYNIARFSDDVSKVIYAGQSVTYLNLQLAYYMGFKEVYLIGMDFSYDIPSSVIKESQTFTSTEEDVNHFHPEYFGKGKKWHDPQLEKVLMSYEKSKEIFEKSERKIYNATVGGKLEIFERKKYETLF